MTISDFHPYVASARATTTANVLNSTVAEIASKAPYVQEPVAIVGIACRLPGESKNPQALWDFLQRGGIANNQAPESRFSLDKHHDGSKKPKTMRSPGGMFMEYVDPQDFDAQFFNISRTDAIAMDPQQRQLLEVVYEGLENAGLRLEDMDGASVGCFVGSYAVDYADIQARDPDDRAPSVTVGVGRAILSNRISHFLNIKGPSMTVDTACSGSLVGVDVACRYLSTREINGAIVAGANMYLSPEHNMDSGAMKGASSLSGKCHTFDVKADGYIKAEAVNAVILKRLDDAVRDGDPIRAVIRGTATNSDGRTPGIASPSSEAQATAIRAAYANANITDLSQTTYLECHGTGTQAGDPLEVSGVSSVFAKTRTMDQPLIIGSIKSNIGHSEPAAGISGMLKAILALENGYIPGNPTFETPNPKIDFKMLKVRASRTGLPWPVGAMKRASVNSFGYGGSNAHVVLDSPDSLTGQNHHVSSCVVDEEDFFADTVVTRPHVLVFSANNEKSLRAYTETISKYLLNPGVSIQLPDLAYTLSERRTRHFHRAYVVANTQRFDDAEVFYGKRSPEAPRIGFVFTGQGAQWSQMGKDIVETFPYARTLLQHLDDVLQALPKPPHWSLLSELTEPRRPETLRLPEFSQPLVTALQLVILGLLKSWSIQPEAVVGHSSGEIAAACAAGYLTQEEAIKVAYFRGQAATECKDDSQPPVGMMAVGLGPNDVQKYMQGSENQVQIACFNSPSSVTLSGELAELEKVKSRLDQDKHFARMLQVNLAYHSRYMEAIGKRYGELLRENCDPPLKGNGTIMFSTVTGEAIDQDCNDAYWVSNAVNPVRFAQATKEMLSGPIDFLIELGPSGALSAPITQIKKALPSQGDNVQYCAASARGRDSVKALLGVAGRLFVKGGSADLQKVNADHQSLARSMPSVIVDLPNYVFDHSTKYWHESEASKDWRFRQFAHHDLLGSKILGTSWQAPSWRKVLRVEDLPWLRDHRMGSDIVFPGAGYMAMAMEAIYQTTSAIAQGEGRDVENRIRYRLRDVRFPKALVLEEGKQHKLMLSLTRYAGRKESWHGFKVLSLIDDVWNEHSSGLVRLEEDLQKATPNVATTPLQHTTPGHLWYKAMYDAGYNFGPLFQKQLEVESTSGVRESRSYVSLTEPESKYPQSDYPMHPACIDGCMQTCAPSLWKGNRTNVNAVLVPAIIDNLVINARTSQKGIAVTNSRFAGPGRPEETKSYLSNASVYDVDTGSLVFELSGLRYHKIDTREDLHAMHKYSRLDWKPDVTYLTQAALSSKLLGEDVSDKINQIVDVIAHKKPNLKVMEVSLIAGDSSSIWLEGPSAEKSMRAACDKLSLTTNDAGALIDAQEKYQSQDGVTFSMLDLATAPQDFISTTDEDFDLLIVKTLLLPENRLKEIAANARKLLKQGGNLLLLEQEPNISDSSSSSSDIVHVQSKSCLNKPTAFLSEDLFHNILQVPVEDNAYRSAYLSRAAGPPNAAGQIDLVYLGQEPTIASQIKIGLAELNWQVAVHTPDAIRPGSIALVVDELSAPVLKEITPDRWRSLQDLLSSGVKILWVTAGSQFDVTHPDTALIHGLGRTVRAEDPTISLTTLDVESSSSPKTLWAINEILRSLQNPSPKRCIESEYVERKGVIYVSRIRPDEAIDQAERDDTNGAEPQALSLHNAPSTIRYRCERPGTLDSLHYAEVAAEELPLEENRVEVEIFAAGLNFKDVAVSMGIVPENHHLLGLEGAGVVRRVGKGVKSFKVGQRVGVFEKGTFANRIIATTERTFALPDNLSFEDASTMPSVYLTTIHSLFNLGNTQKGHRVLIHSASGGVGIASIHLCQYIGAEIFATVGTEEKRRFLSDSFNIPSSHIFNSRSTVFAADLMRATKGKGVDVILNSLTGDLLDESWRCIANGGVMIEIGKKDMLDRNSLAMEPFSWNATYRGFDMSHEHVSDKLIARLLSQMMDLLAKGHIKPISPIKSFPFEDIASAFRFMRGGSHIGKIVITNGLNAKIEVPTRPAPRQLRFESNESYLIVGGLKGLCGSLAVYLAQQGAKHLVILSRSGYADERSQTVLNNLNAEACKVDLVRGDVSVLEDVQRTFKEASAPIRGVIQGAMVLRDKIFTSMTVQEYHTTIASKVQGTWNLHSVALEQSRPLRFFTLLSSISGVVGQKGQANYAAANVFLDNFASYRHKLGLAANSVDLGAIEDVGYMNEHSDLVVALDKAAWTPINESLFHKIVRFSLLQQQMDISQAYINSDSRSQLITSIAVPQRESSALLADARFGPLFFSTGKGSGSSGDSRQDSAGKAIQAFFVMLRSGTADKSIVLAACVDILNRQFSQSLRLSEPMEPAKSLASYGLDSLAAVEFRNWVRIELGAEVSTLDITNASSLVALGEKVVNRLAAAQATEKATAS